jgi:hypothetical protein
MKTNAAELVVEAADDIEAADDVEDESAVRDGLTKVTERVSHPLELAAVVGGEISLAEVVKLRVKEEGTSFPVPQELGFDGEPSTMSSGVADEDDVSKLGGDGADDPRLDNTVHPGPVRRERNVVVVDNVTLQGVLADDEEKGVAPPSVEGGGVVEEDKDESPDILDINCPSVEVDQHNNFMEKSVACGGDGRGVVVDGEVGGDVVVHRSSGGAGLGSTREGVHRSTLLGGCSRLAFSFTSARKGEIAGVEAGSLFLLGALCLGSSERARVGVSHMRMGWGRMVTSHEQRAGVSSLGCNTGRCAEREWKQHQEAR